MLQQEKKKPAKWTNASLIISSPCKSIGSTDTLFLKCHIAGFFLIFLWILMILLSCAIYGSGGYIFYGTLHGVKFYLSYLVASSILQSICCLWTRCNATTYFCWQNFYFKSNVKNTVVTSVLRGLDFFYWEVWWVVMVVLFIRSKTMLLFFLSAVLKMRILFE